MDSISSFLEMGGYAAYIWPAYGLSAVILVTLLVTSVRFLRSSRADLEVLRSASGERDIETQA